MTSPSPAQKKESSPYSAHIETSMGDALDSIRLTIQGNLKQKVQDKTDLDVQAGAKVLQHDADESSDVNVAQSESSHENGLKIEGITQTDVQFVSNSTNDSSVLRLTKDLQITSDGPQVPNDNHNHQVHMDKNALKGMNNVSDKSSIASDLDPEKVSQTETSNVFYLTQVLEDDGSITKLDAKENKKDVQKRVDQQQKQEVTTKMTENTQEKTVDSNETAAAPSEAVQADDFVIGGDQAGTEAVAPSAEAPQSGATTAAESNLSAAADIAMGMNTTTGTGQSNAELASKATLAESAAALGTLADIAKQIKSQPAPNAAEPVTSQNAGDYTVDALMREMLKPLLKEWLDAHLPSLVKWLVTEQIEKMLKYQLGMAPAEEVGSDAEDMNAEDLMASFDAPAAEEKA